MAQMLVLAGAHSPLQTKNLPPQVLIMHPTTSFTLSHSSKLAQKFDVLIAWESQLPLDKFLTTHGTSVQAMLALAYYKMPQVNKDLLRLLPALKLVLTASAGVNHIDLVECRRRGIAIANAGSSYSTDVADIALGLFIDVYRKISAADRHVRQGLWSTCKRDYPLGSKLGGKRVGIVGLGSIGLEVAKRLEAFGCIVSYNSRSNNPYLPYHFYSNVWELAANSDALIICCALTDQTCHIINKQVLSALGREGVIIAEKELVRCLVHGEIRGAGLDVFENEPHVPKELFGLDNVVLSPHRGVFTEESLQGSNELMIANLEAFFSNKPLLTPYSYMDG